MIEWRSQPIRVLSPLPATVALSRLRAGRVSGLVLVARRKQGVLRALVRRVERLPRRPARIAFGSVRGERISVSAGRPEVRNSWRAFVRGRIAPTSTGCEFVGTVGWHPAVLLLCALWLGLLGLIALTSSVVAIADAAAGDWAHAGNAVLVLGAATVIALMGAGIAIVANRFARTDDAWLRAWLGEQLEATVETQKDKPPDRLYAHSRRRAAG